MTVVSNEWNDNNKLSNLVNVPATIATNAKTEEEDEKESEDSVLNCVILKACDDGEKAMLGLLPQTITRKKQMEIAKLFASTIHLKLLFILPTETDWLL